MENNRDFWTEFIETYREHSCLWNVTSNEYSNKHKRNASYEILLRKLKEINPTATLEFLKKKINNMRTAFRRELKKVQDSKGTGTGTDNLYEPTLWYYDLLLFTSQSECGRKGKATDEHEDDLLENNNTMDADDDNEYERGSAPTTPLYSLDDLESQSTSVEDNSISTPLSTKSSSFKTINSQKRKVTKKVSASEQKKMRVLDLAHNVLTSNTNNDENENEYAIAGKRIGYQLKGVDERQRIIAEKLISDVMFYAKMGKLTEDSTVNCNNPSTQKNINSSSLYQFSSCSSSEFNNSNSRPYSAQHSQSTTTTPQNLTYHTLQVQNHTFNEDSNSDIRHNFNNYKPSGLNE